MTSTGAAVSAIRHLNRHQRLLPLAFKNVLLACDADPYGVCRWIRRHERGRRPHSPTFRSVAKYFSMDRMPGNSNGELLSRDLSRSSPSLVTSDVVEDIQFIVLGTPERVKIHGKAYPSEPITHLPISLESLARFVQRTAEAKNVQRGASSAERMDLLQLQSRACDIHPSLSECVKLLLPPRSVDLMIVDFSHDNLASFLEDSLIVGSFLLSPDGSLLLVYSEDTRGKPHIIDSDGGDASSASDLSHFAKLKFRESYWRRLGGGTRYFYGTSSAAGSEVGRAVDRSDFPGFLPKGTRRARRWNPYERHKFKRAEFLGPSFTTARHTKESLQNMSNRLQEEEDTLERKSEELFGVSFEMVEKQSFYSKRDN